MMRDLCQSTNRPIAIKRQGSNASVLILSVPNHIEVRDDQSQCTTMACCAPTKHVSVSVGPGIAAAGSKTRSHGNTRRS